jgi:hypothetical protein
VGKAEPSEVAPDMATAAQPKERIGGRARARFEAADRGRLQFDELRPDSLAAPREPTERPLWQLVALLYATLALVVACVIALTFAVASLVAGAAY